MDLATIIGLIGGLSIVLGTMLFGGNVLLYLDLHAILIVFVGSSMVVMMKFGIHQFLGAFHVAGNAFISKPQTPLEIIEKAVELASLARKEGILALEYAKLDNEFFKSGIRYLVDGLDINIIRATLTKEMNSTVERHDKGQKIFKAIAEAGPSMGMIGTLIGLVQMLSHMDDPKSIGPAMAIALLTTLYGAILANMIAAPIAEKLSLRSDEERLTKSIVIDAIVGIHAGQNPRILEDLLKAYLPGSKRQNPLEDEPYIEIN